MWAAFHWHDNIMFYQMKMPPFYLNTRTSPGEAVVTLLPSRWIAVGGLSSAMSINPCKSSSGSPFISAQKNWILRQFTTLRPRQNCRRLADNIFKCILLHENVWISLKIALKFAPRLRINNIPALVQMMSSHQPGAKPLSELMMVKLLTHIRINRPQWVKNHNSRYMDS